MLHAGEIHAAQLTGRDAGAAGITNFLTRQVYLNLRPPGGVSAFDYHPGDLANLAAHESEHVDQVAGMNPWQRLKFSLRFSLSPAFKELMEANAYQFGCDSARGDFGYARICANLK